MRGPSRGPLCGLGVKVRVIAGEIGGFLVLGHDTSQAVPPPTDLTSSLQGQDGAKGDRGEDGEPGQPVSDQWSLSLS